MYARLSRGRLGAYHPAAADKSEGAGSSISLALENVRPFGPPHLRCIVTAPFWLKLVEACAFVLAGVPRTPHHRHIMLFGSNEGPKSDNDGVFHNLILTDLVEVVPDIDNPSAMQLHELTQRNIAALRNGGAQGPLYGYSGFDDRGSFKPYTDLVEQSKKTAGLTIWGSPHWSHADDTTTQAWKDSNAFKTNAWESMSWLSNRGFVLMSFGEQFKPEFWHPKYNREHKKGTADTRVKRHLIVAEGFFREYKPLSSGPEFHYVGSGTGAVMVAMLVPGRFKHCVAWANDDQIDVGLTLARVVKALNASECAIELGGQSFCLSYEMVLALKEHK